MKTSTERDALVSLALQAQETLNRALDTLAEQHNVDCGGVGIDHYRDPGVLRSKERVTLHLRFNP